MKKQLLLLLMHALTTGAAVYAQKADSTAKIRTDLLAQLNLTTRNVAYNDNEKDSIVSGKSDSALVSLFHVDDKDLRRSLYSVTVKEYRNGVKVAEENIFTRKALELSNLMQGVEDSSSVFSLFRKEINHHTVRFSYRIPGQMTSRVYQVSDTDDYIIVTGTPYFGKVPLDKPFTLFVYTSPDRTNNFPFYKEDNRKQVDPANWSEVYQLRHSFVIDLTIHRLPDETKTENGSGLKKNGRHILQ